jgi:hypothetical protein
MKPGEGIIVESGVSSRVVDGSGVSVDGGVAVAKAILAGLQATNSTARPNNTLKGR